MDIAKALESDWQSVVATIMFKQGIKSITVSREDHKRMKRKFPRAELKIDADGDGSITLTLR